MAFMEMVARRDGLNDETKQLAPIMRCLLGHRHRDMIYRAFSNIWSLTTPCGDIVPDRSSCEFELSLPA
jgi:hypothetical protein